MYRFSDVANVPLRRALSRAGGKSVGAQGGQQAAAATRRKAACTHPRRDDTTRLGPRRARRARPPGISAGGGALARSGRSRSHEARPMRGATLEIAYARRPTRSARKPTADDAPLLAARPALAGACARADLALAFGSRAWACWTRRQAQEGPCLSEQAEACRPRPRTTLLYVRATPVSSGKQIIPLPRARASPSPPPTPLFPTRALRRGTHGPSSPGTLGFHARAHACAAAGPQRRLDVGGTTSACATAPLDDRLQPTLSRRLSLSRVPLAAPSNRTNTQVPGSPRPAQRTHVQ